MTEDYRAHLTGFRVGSLLAGYRLESQVGAGGMAVVFRARDERLNRRVALKILAPALASDPEFRSRFIAESRAAAAVVAARNPRPKCPGKRSLSGVSPATGARRGLT